MTIHLNLDLMFGSVQWLIRVFGVKLSGAANPDFSDIPAVLRHDAARDWWRTTGPRFLLVTAAVRHVAMTVDFGRR